MPLVEFGLDPTRPGMELCETLIDEDLKYNPNCPCKTRPCPQHGFCKVCTRHHASHGIDADGPGCHRFPREAVGTVKGDRFHDANHAEVVAEMQAQEELWAEDFRSRAPAEPEPERKAYSGEFKLSELPVGARIKEPGTGLYFLVAAQDHYAEGLTTLIAENVIRCAAFDALEPENKGKLRWWDEYSKYGCNDFETSNLVQWLNSEKFYWYRPAHEKDAAPDACNLRYGEMPNFDIPGFLYDFDKDFLAGIRYTEVPVLKRIVKGKGELVNVNCRVFMPSRTELGLGNENGYAEGAPLPFFAGRKNLLAKPTDEQMAIYGRSWNPGWEFGSRGKAPLDAPQIFDPKFGWWYWARTPHLTYGYLNRVMNPYGAFSYTMAFNDNVGVRPMFNMDGAFTVSEYEA